MGECDKFGTVLRIELEFRPLGMFVNGGGADTKRLAALMSDRPL